ncbi:photosystem II protein PsbQ [Cyanobium sp. ATX 6A2]|uniref:photosystem II protein PsbQ n=1 Tax=Cyanobium sp. ATX 6A2 TaxID=2823700 RepID=UPI0037BFF2C5
MAPAQVFTPLPSTQLSTLLQQLRRLLSVALAAVLCFSLAACGGAKAQPPTLSAEDITYIERQAEGFLAARDRLPELADLVNQRDWTFTRNLIHGPMQEVGRHMLYINRRLLPDDQAEATRLADQLKRSLAQLDEAARLQDADALRKTYISVASGFGKYAQILPAQVQEDLKQI